MKPNTQKTVVGLIKRGSKVLLIKRKQKEGDLVWAFPGGKVEAGEEEQEAIERELFEETHVQCVNLRKIGQRKHPQTGVDISYWVGEYKRKSLRKGSVFLKQSGRNQRKQSD